MNQPDEITRQLASKYTHELYLPVRGIAKYDSVTWFQNYKGWQPLQDKDWEQTFEFQEVPLGVYKQYDEQRMSLVDELSIAIEDKIIENDLDRTMKRMLPADYNLLQIIMTEGPISEHYVNKQEDKDTFKETLKRCRSRGLITPSKASEHHYNQDITTLGLEILKVKHLIEEDPEKLKKRLHEQD